MTVDYVDYDQLPSPVADQLAERLVRFASPVVKKSEARILAGFDSMSALDRWLRKNQIKPCSHGRYPRHKIRRALEIEAGLKRR